MNSRSRVFLLLAVAALAFFLLKARRPQPSPPAPPIEMTAEDSTPLPTPTPIASAQSNAAILAAVEQPTPWPVIANSALTHPPHAATNSVQPPKPPPHGLPYVRNGELIVVFGDVLYGKAKDAPPTGYVKTMPVDTWDNSTIPYFIATDLPNPERVNQAIKYFNEHTHVRFVPFAGQADAIVFEKGTKDCLSYVGRIGGHQPIYLDDRCGQTEILHELMHVLGFVHEQSRPDRDQYLKIRWENIQLDDRTQFDIAPDEVTRISTSLPFDYHSIMLYKPSMFALRPELKTMESATNDAIDPSDQLSRDDLNRLDKTYVQ